MLSNWCVVVLLYVFSRYVDDYDAILLAIEGGQAAGAGFADVITGAVSPSGMLPFTMYVTKSI